MIVSPLNAGEPATRRDVGAVPHDGDPRLLHRRARQLLFGGAELDFGLAPRLGGGYRRFGRIVGRPGQEALVGAERHLDSVGDALEVVVLGTVQLHHDTDYVVLELRVAHVEYAAPLDPVG